MKTYAIRIVDPAEYYTLGEGKREECDNLPIHERIERRHNLFVIYVRRNAINCRTQTISRIPRN